MRPHDLWSRHRRRRQPAARLRQAIRLERSSTVPCRPQAPRRRRPGEGGREERRCSRGASNATPPRNVVCVGEPLACDGCGNAIVGPRWSCIFCEGSVDLCVGCVGKAARKPLTLRGGGKHPPTTCSSGCARCRHRPRPRRARRHRRAGDPGGRLGRRRHLGCLDRSDGRRRRRAPRRRWRQRRRRRRRLAQAAHRPRRRRRRRRRIRIRRRRRGGGPGRPHRRRRAKRQRGGLVGRPDRGGLST